MTTSDTLLRRFADSLASAGPFTGEPSLKARLCLMDFLACALAAGDFAWVRQARAVAIANTGTEQGAPLIGTSARVSGQDAAFANAVAGHSLVRDDMHLGSVSHLGVVVIPTALALAATESVSGARLLEAIVCGYEAGGKLGAMLMDVDTARRFRPTGLISAFAAAATGARLLGLDADHTAHALGLASNYLAGFNEWADWGSDDMYFHPGIAARNGITALQLARAGAVAAAGALDGKAGLFRALGKDVPASPLPPFAGDAEILAVFFKQVPACNYAQTAAQVARKLQRRHQPDCPSITDIQVDVPYAAAHYPGCDYAGPFTSILQARMSIQFNVASALLHGDFDDDHYRRFDDEAVAALAKRTRVRVDDTLSQAYPAAQGATVTMTLASGETLDSHLDDLVPASAEEVENRFLAAASGTLGDNRANVLATGIRHLEHSADTAFLQALSAS